MADAGDHLSRSLKLSKCNIVKQDIINNFRDYCFCVENEVDFQKSGVEDEDEE